VDGVWAESAASCCARPVGTLPGPNLLKQSGGACDPIAGESRATCVPRGSMRGVRDSESATPQCERRDPKRQPLEERRADERPVQPLR